MNKEELLKEIIELPKIETNNPISAMIGINVDDFMNAVDRLNKIPDYNDLLNENQGLKKQLEENQNPLKGIFAQVNDDTLLRDCGNMDAEINELKNQQKEFIKYLEEKLNFYKINTQGYSMNLVEEILQKYKSIIGGKHE